MVAPLLCLPFTLVSSDHLTAFIVVLFFSECYWLYSALHGNPVLRDSFTSHHGLQVPIFINLSNCCLEKETPASRATCGWPRLVRTPLTSVQLKRCDSRVSPFNSSLCEAHVIITHLLCQRSRKRAILSVLAPCSRPLSCLLSSTRFLSFCWFYSGTKRTLLNCLCGLFSWALEDSRLLPLFYPTLYHMHNALNAWRRLVCVSLTLCFFFRVGSQGWLLDAKLGIIAGVKTQGRVCPCICRRGSSQKSYICQWISSCFSSSLVLQVPMSTQTCVYLQM